jgi:hypothetical protein
VSYWEKIRALLVAAKEKAVALPTLILGCLDWLVKVAERLMVLGIAYVVFYFGYRFYHGSLSKEEDASIALAAQSWKIIFILLVPLFYQTVRIFLEEVQVAAGMTRVKKALNESDPSAPIPPSPPNPGPGSLPGEE